MSLNYFKSLDGHEFWTNAFGNRFGERVAVMVEYPYVWHDGKRFTPTTQEKRDMWKDYIHGEFGSDAQIKKQMEEEFGRR